MCDTEICKEILNTILNKYIPSILPTLNNYVVKGGRASDFYISKNTGQQLFGFTDWDLACNSGQSQLIIKDTIISALKENGIRDIQTQKITTQDNKSGIQLGIKCDNDICFFVDIVIYDNSDPIFKDNITNEGINYVNLNYLLDDLQTTNSERTLRLSDELNNFHINDINTNDLTNNVESYINIIKEQLIRKRTSKAVAEIASIMRDSTLDENEKLEDIEEVNNRTSIDINNLISEIIPEFKSKFEKLLRTNYRLKMLQQMGGRKIIIKTKKIKTRKIKSKIFKKNKTKKRL